jgi:hypothetical protein
MEALPLTGEMLYIPFGATATLLGGVSFQGVVSAPSAQPLVWGCSAVDIVSCEINQEELRDRIQIVPGDGGLLDPMNQLNMFVAFYLGAAIRDAAIASLSSPVCSGP